MHRASCLCGAVTWEIGGPYTFMHHCHCSRCRKSHGVGGMTAIGVAQVRMHDETHVRRWPSSPAFERAFCGRCGSVVPSNLADELIFVPAGNLLDDPGVRPEARIFVASAAPWEELHDALPRFDAFPPGADYPVLPDPSPVTAPPGEIHGSCLCGRVAFVIDQPPLFARFCHCGRCRRARSAAASVNLAVPIGAVHVTRGADAMVRYKVPDAERYTQVFCGTCGSPLPADIPARNMTVVPMGSLDTDPGIRPQCHIFVASKAPWDVIADGLPQYDEYPPA